MLSAAPRRVGAVLSLVVPGARSSGRCRACRRRADRRRRRRSPTACRRCADIGRELFTTTRSPSRSPRCSSSSPWSAPWCWPRRPSEARIPMITLNHFLLLSGVLFSHRHGRRLPAAQPDHDPAVDRDHAQRRQPHVRRRRAGTSGSVDGQIIVFFVMTVAAAEAAVGLAIVIALFRHRRRCSPDAFTSLKW